MTKNDPAAGLTYRLMREDEVDTAVRLFDLAGWGPMQSDWLHRWFFEAGPLGLPIVVVAVDPSDEVLGMMTYSPYEVQLFDRVGLACRGRATILDPRIR